MTSTLLEPTQPVTTAEYFYDYAAQDPINGYDLGGTTPWGRCDANGWRAAASCLVTARSAWCNSGSAAHFAACYPSGPASIDVNITFATPYKLGPITIGVTVGVQMGDGGFAPYVGPAVGSEISASVTVSPSRVNRGRYVTAATCSPPIADGGSVCGGLNNRGNVSIGVGLGVGTAIETRYSIGKSRKNH